MGPRVGGGRGALESLVEVEGRAEGLRDSMRLVICVSWKTGKNVYVRVQADGKNNLTETASES